MLYPLYMTNIQNLDEYWVNYLNENDVIESEDEISKRLVFMAPSSRRMANVDNISLLEKK